MIKSTKVAVVGATAVVTSNGMIFLLTRNEIVGQISQVAFDSVSGVDPSSRHAEQELEFLQKAQFLVCKNILPI